MRKQISLSELKERLSYNPMTGVFLWKIRPRQRACSEIAGSVRSTDGYRQICIKQTMYKAHRLAWFYVHGVWPKEQIDHINGDKADNCIANLRLADFSKNQANSKRRSTNRSGFKGIWFHKFSGLWAATITVNRKPIHLGYFKTPEEAHEAYKAAAVQYFGEYARAA